MYQIEENAKLEMENVISFRGVVTHAQINERVSEMLRVIEANNAFKTGSVVNTTFSIDPNGVEPLLDVEILIPINRKINLSAPYSYKPIFKLNNAIKVKHYGAPETVHESADALNDYLQLHSFTPITTGYFVSIGDSSHPEKSEGLTAELYVGISDNIL